MPEAELAEVMAAYGAYTGELEGAAVLRGGADLGLAIHWAAKCQYAARGLIEERPVTLG